MRPFQFFIRRVWCGESHQMDMLIPFPRDLRTGLAWWIEEDRLKKGVSLKQVSPDLQMLSDASRMSWGATLGHLRVRGAFTHNLAIESVLEAAQWRSNTVFKGHYLKEVAFQYQNCKALGLIVAAGTIIIV